MARSCTLPLEVLALKLSSYQSIDSISEPLGCYWPPWSSVESLSVCTYFFFVSLNLVVISASRCRVFLTVVFLCTSLFLGYIDAFKCRVLTRTDGFAAVSLSCIRLDGMNYDRETNHSDERRSRWTQAFFNKFKFINKPSNLLRPALLFHLECVQQDSFGWIRIKRSVSLAQSRKFSTFIKGLTQISSYKIPDCMCRIMRIPNSI